MRRLLLSAALLSALTGCAATVSLSGPWMSPAEKRDYRLARIAEDPSDPGAVEAVRAWNRDPASTLAKDALLSCLPESLFAVEQELVLLGPEQLQQVFARLAAFDTPEVNGFILGALPGLSGETAHVALLSLAGRQDPQVVEALIGALMSGDPEARGIAAQGLAPAESEAARRALLALVLSGADEPVELRTLAARSLMSVDDPAVRLAVLGLVASEDSPVAAALIEGLGAPRSAGEREAAVSATAHEQAAAQAARFLDRDAVLPEVSRQALVALLSASWTEPRWAAAEALGQRGRLEPRSALLAFFDDPERAGRAYALMDAYELAAPEVLRAEATQLEDASARARAGELLARQGGLPGDEALVRALFGGQVPAEVGAALAVAPLALFPGGRVRYTPWPGQQVVDQSLEEAIAWHRSRLDSLGTEAASRYLIQARVVALGGRSQPSLAALEEAAAAARDRARLHLDNQATGQGYLSGDTVRQALRSAIASGLQGIELGADGSPGPHRPYLRASGSVSCSDEIQTRTESDYRSESFTYQAANPAKEAACAAFHSYPGARTTYECEYRCTNARGDSYTLSCDTRDFYGANCNMMQVQVADPTYAALESDCNNRPDTVTVSGRAEVDSETTTTRTTTSCSGSLRVDFAGRGRDMPLRASSTREVVELEEELRYPTGSWEMDSSFPRHQVLSDQDPRSRELSAELARGLQGFSLSASDHRAASRQALAGALDAGDDQAAVELQLWAEPELVTGDYRELGAFVARLLSDGPQAFPPPTSPE